MSGRRFLLPLIATCGALAVGLALGAGPLDDAVHADSSTGSTPGSAAAQQSAAYGETWAQKIAPTLFGGRLAGKTISVVVGPGAPATTVQGLISDIGIAGGKVVSRVTLSASLLDPSQSILVDSLGAKFAQASQGAVATAAPTYTRIGEVLGLAVNGPGATTTTTTTVRVKVKGHWVRKSVDRTTPVAASQVTARETLTTAKLATFSMGTAQADLVLLVLGSTPASGPDLSEFLSGVSAKVGGIVVTGDTASGQAGGTLAALRATKPGSKVLTVDGDDTAYGRDAATLGLVRQLTAGGGDYGASGIDGALP